MDPAFDGPFTQVCQGAPTSSARSRILNAEGFKPIHPRSSFNLNIVQNLLLKLGLHTERFDNSLLAPNEWWIVCRRGLQQPPDADSAKKRIGSTPLKYDPAFLSFPVGTHTTRGHGPAMLQQNGGTHAFHHPVLAGSRNSLPFFLSGTREGDAMRRTLLDLPAISGLTTQCQVDPDEVVLDFAEVGFVTAAELGQLVGLHTRLRGRGLRLTIQNVRAEVQEIFQITGLIRVLTIRPTAAAGRI